MVISGGVNIYPVEIEAALQMLPGVADCAVFGRGRPADLSVPALHRCPCQNFVEDSIAIETCITINVVAKYVYWTRAIG